MSATCRRADGRPWILVPQYFGSLVYGARTFQYLPFDVAATRLLTRLVDVAFPEILNATQSALLRRAYTAFYEHLHSQGFFTLTDHFDGSVLPLQPPDSHLTGPLTVHLAGR